MRTWQVAEERREPSGNWGMDWGTISLESGVRTQSIIGAGDMALSDAAIRSLKPRERSYKAYDRDGLFLLVSPSGSKLWRWRYRFDRKEKLMALGE